MLHLSMSRHTPHAQEKMKRNAAFSVFHFVSNPSLWSTHLDLRSKTRENCWYKYINMFQMKCLRFQMIPFYITRWSRTFGPDFPSARRAALLWGLRPVYMLWFDPCRRKSGVGPKVITESLTESVIQTDRQPPTSHLDDSWDQVEIQSCIRHCTDSP